jgi:hypothetical protein
MAKATKDFSQSSSPQVTTPEELRDFLEDAVQKHPEWFYRPFGAMGNAPIIDMLSRIGVLSELDSQGRPSLNKPCLINEVSAPIFIKVVLGIEPSSSSIRAGLFHPVSLQWLLDTYGNPDLHQDILKRCAVGRFELPLFANFMPPDTLRIYVEKHAEVRYNEYHDPYMTGSPEAVVAALRKNPDLLDKTSFPAVKNFYDTACMVHMAGYIAPELREDSKELIELEKILSAYTTPAPPAAPATPAPM